MIVPNRHGNSNNYRYGFQGQELDNEIKGEGNSLNYKYRMHDPRVGRFFAVDILEAKYPFWSPYNFAGNNPIMYIDEEGNGPIPPTLLKFLAENFSMFKQGMKILKGTKGNNFSLEKVHKWVTGKSNYLDGYRKVKGIVGEGLVFAELSTISGFEKGDVKWHSNRSTADIFMHLELGTESNFRVGFDIASGNLSYGFVRTEKSFSLDYQDLFGNENTMFKTEGNFTVLIEVKTLAVNNKTFNGDRLQTSLINGMKQVIKQIKDYKENNPDAVNVMGVLWVDKEVIDKAMSETAGIKTAVLQKTYQEFTKKGGYIHGVKGTNKEKTNLNGKAHVITDKLEKGARKVLKLENK